MLSSPVIGMLAQQQRRLDAARGMTLVIKVGGSIQDDPAQLAAIMADVVRLRALGARPVVVHGGGKAITAAMSKAGLAAKFVQGQRYTDPPTLAIVEDVLVNTVNRELIEHARAAGGRAVGLHSLARCVLFGVRTGTEAREGAPSEDLGLVGRVTRVDADAINRVLGDQAGEIPVIAPVAIEEDGRRRGAASETKGKLNVNADLAAGAVAAALKPDRFLLVSDTAGIRPDPTNASLYAPSLSRAQTQALIDSGVIAGGMLPKVQACFMAQDAGVHQVAIIDGRCAGATLAAALVDEREPVIGTRMTN